MGTTHYASTCSSLVLAIPAPLLPSSDSSAPHLSQRLPYHLLLPPGHTTSSIDISVHNTDILHLKLRKHLAPLISVFRTLASEPVSRDTALFWRIVGLVWRIVGLFWRIVSLFSHMVLSYTNGINCKWPAFVQGRNALSYRRHDSWYIGDMTRNM